MEEQILATTEEGLEKFLKILNDTLGEKHLVINPDVHFFDYDSEWEDYTPGSFHFRKVVETKVCEETVGNASVAQGVLSSHSDWELWLTTGSGDRRVHWFEANGNEVLVFGKDADTFFTRCIDKSAFLDIPDDTLIKIKE